VFQTCGKKMQNEIPKTKFNIVTVQEDPESGDLLVPIPEEILNTLKWNEDTILEIEILSHGVISIIEKHEK
jgi:hypothetical protein